MGFFGKVRFFSIASLFLFSLVSVGCSFYVDKANKDESEDESFLRGQKTQVSYDLVNQQVFIPRCISCHGSAGGVSLESYELVIQNLAAVERTALITKTMPKRSPLTAKEVNLLRAWIEAGAPKDAEAQSTEESNLNPQEDQHESDPNNPAPSPGDFEKLSYEMVNSQVFRPKCISCHGDEGGVNLESYQMVKAQLESIQRAVFVEKTMPLRSSLSPAQSNLLKKWIEMGAPFKEGSSEPPPDNEHSEEKSPPGSEVPPEAPDHSHGEVPEPKTQGDSETSPLVPTFDSIKGRILAPKCLNCHSERGEAARIPLVSLKNLLNSPHEIVIPGNVEESGLVIATERKDPKRMPPPDAGEGLSDEEVKIIKEWIERGAKD